LQNTEFNCRNSSAACIFALALRCQGNLINPVPQTILGVEGRRAFKKSSGAACMLALTLLCQGCRVDLVQIHRLLGASAERQWGVELHK
jgi:hypothetical protein